jgi:acyl-CoA synthetase (AMP-forming)/AMP-acid ligase II
VALVRAYRVRVVTAEPDLLEQLRGVASLVSVSLPAAKRIICGARCGTHQALYQRVTRTFPKLRRYVTVLPTDRIAMASRWQTIVLIAVALALAITTLTHYLK